MFSIAKRLVAVILALGICGHQTANAGFIGMPRELGAAVKRIAFSHFTLPPMAFTQFCLRYADQCKESKRIVFRGGPVRLTAERWADLKAVNDRVNGAIVPQPNTGGLATEKWLIAPSHGDCNDYAVTKRHELLARGWPSRALLLAEVVTRAGEHHLVVVARTKQGDFVLDNMSGAIRPWMQAPYRWVRIQSAANPKYWSTVRLSARSV